MYIGHEMEVGISGIEKGNMRWRKGFRSESRRYGQSTKNALKRNSSLSTMNRQTTVKSVFK